jgi:hypothetical protein
MMPFFRNMTVFSRSPAQALAILPALHIFAFANSGRDLLIPGIPLRPPMPDELRHDKLVLRLCV